METQMLTIIWRNLWRRKARSMAVLWVVGLGLGLMLLAGGVEDGGVDSAIARTTGFLPGHVSVTTRAFSARREPGDTLEDYGALLRELRGAPGVVGVAPRMEFTGLISSSGTPGVWWCWG